MPLVKATLEGAIRGALDSAAALEEGAEAARAMLASKISNAIHDYVSAADVNPGIAVTVSPSTHIGATTIKGTLS